MNAREQETPRDAESALSVVGIDDEIRRRGSARLMGLPPWHGGFDLYPIARHLPEHPTAEQYDELAADLSNLIEDLHRVHVDRRASPGDEIGRLAPVMQMPVIARADRARAGEISEDCIRTLKSIRGALAGIARESLCMLYLHIAPWPGYDQESQRAAIDALARPRGLRCCRAGELPDD